MTTKFAILCRVSTSEQEEKGTSLEVQQKTLRQCVEQLNGIVVKEYIGQEHSTQGHERPILEELLSDSDKKKFQALIVYDLSRLTRDPIKSKFILANLKKNDIRLFEQTREHDLNSPETVLYAGIMSEVNAYQVAINIKKSTESRIELAKKGWLMTGKLPWGRKLTHHNRDKKPEWILDEDKASLAQKIYDLYINKGFYVEKISNLIGLDDDVIYRILKDDGVFRQAFKHNGKIVETLIPIPRLFTQEQSIIIREKLKNNKLNNSAKYQYLLKGMIHCQECKLNYTGYTANYGKNRRYIHSRHKETPTCLKSVNQPLLEKSVLDVISELVSNNQLLMDTIRHCNQNTIQKAETLKKEIELLETQQNKLEKRKAKAIKLILDGTIDESDVVNELEKIKKKLDKIITELLSKKTELDSLDSIEIPDEVLERIKYTFDSLKGHYGKNISDWDFPIKRMLVEWFFGFNKENGVWLRQSDKKEILYTIKSNFGCIAFGWLGDEDGPAGVIPGTNKINPGTIDKFAAIVNIITKPPEPLSSKFVIISFRLLKIEISGSL